MLYVEVFGLEIASFEKKNNATMFLSWYSPPWTQLWLAIYLKFNMFLKCHLMRMLEDSSFIFDVLKMKLDLKECQVTTIYAKTREYFSTSITTLMEITKENQYFLNSSILFTRTGKTRFIIHFPAF